jgi:hypothetical protein
MDVTDVYLYDMWALVMEYWWVAPVNTTFGVRGFVPFRGFVPPFDNERPVEYESDKCFVRELNWICCGDVTLYNQTFDYFYLEAQYTCSIQWFLRKDQSYTVCVAGAFDSIRKSLHNLNFESSLSVLRKFCKTWILDPCSDKYDRDCFWASSVASLVQ